jgi:hypothetical protein
MPWRHMAEWRHSSTILDLRIRWRWAVSFTPLPFYSYKKSPWYPMDRKLGVPHSQSGHCGEENYLVCAGNQTLIVQLSLYWLSYPDSSSKEFYFLGCNYMWSGEVNRCFVWTHCPSSGLKNIPCKKPAWRSQKAESACFMLVSCLAWQWWQHVPLKHWLIFTGLHSIISQKRELYISKGLDR